MTIPLGKAAPGSRSEDLYAHPSASAKRVVWPTERLKLGVSVGANFAVEINLFVLRGSPFHGNKLLWDFGTVKYTVTLARIGPKGKGQLCGHPAPDVPVLAGFVAVENRSGA